MKEAINIGVRLHNNKFSIDNFIYFVGLEPTENQNGTQIVQTKKIGSQPKTTTRSKINK